MNQTDLQAYMSDTISRVMKQAYRNILSNPREAKFVFHMQQLFAKSERRRKKVAEQEGIDVPPFLISSIATQCNLHCKGCYARSNGIANDSADYRKATLTPQQWRQVFAEAAEIGINFSLTIAIRYYSKFGHSKQMAEAIEDIVGAKAATVAEPLNEPVDTLIMGAGVFLGKVNGAVMDFIATLISDKVKCVILFGSCAIIDSPVPQMRKALEARGIKVCDQSFTCKGSMGPIHSGHPNAQDIEAFRQFVQSTIKN